LDGCSGNVFAACKVRKKENSDTFDYSSELTSKAGVQIIDFGGGVLQPEVKNPVWGLNRKKTDGEESFKGTNAIILEKPDSFWDITLPGGDGDADMKEDFDFFDDLDDSFGSSRSGPEITEADVLNQIGWQTQDMPEQDVAEVQGVFSNEPFVGFGSCPYKGLGESDLNNISNPVGAVKFYLFALRNQCSKPHFRRLLELFNKGLLTVNGDKSLSIPADNPLIKTSKLTKAEVDDFLRAFETSMFSHVYAAEVRNPSLNVTDPNGAKITRSVFMIVSMALHTLSKAIKTVPSHYILIIRNLLKTLKSASVKATQDEDRLNTCEKCSQDDKDQVRDSVTSLMAIQHFIPRVLTLVEKGADPYLAYEYFFKKNTGYIKE
jgi:hypothetical protein